MKTAAKKTYYAVQCEECKRLIPLKPVEVVSSWPTKREWHGMMLISCPHCEAAAAFTRKKIHTVLLEDTPISKGPLLFPLK